ncbi:uncharacterized protein At5g08430-like isoform X2 [Argentina anserina]|uniref:uncharacterized protein At5g08430-like isoform X2 n=1 Tax=Argentina anserina TaxID=57926 RepID=UPI002176946A|nr:uncharacterized protein At5g08430-like isoform X2 [Potentilla anserina]
MGSFTWVGEYNAAVSAADVAPVRRSKRLHRPRKMEFLGWGSRPVIEFLDSIGKDTSKPISQYDVASIVTEYVNQNKLLHPTKKKRIVCDEKLHSLFGRKTIARIKIYDLLQPHFADNLEDDSDDSFDDSDDEASDDEAARKSNQRRRAALHAPLPAPKSCYAAVIPENVKLVYLRRSVVEALVKQEEAQVFEEKVVGSFVRTKADPHDYTQKNSHVLMQVKAVLKKTKPNSEESCDDGDGGGGGVLLQLHGAFKDFPISMLSDDNFSTEECDDLRERVKGGLLKRPTVVELQQKVQVLHLDVTEHWLARELQFLQKAIDRFNEKGWRRELFEHLERRQLLESPDEQARLLQEIPDVIAEELEVEQKDSPHAMEQGTHGSPGCILRGDSIPSSDIPVEGTLITWTAVDVHSEEYNTKRDDSGLVIFVQHARMAHCKTSRNNLQSL